MAGLKGLSELLAGTLCPNMKLRFSPVVEGRHSAVKHDALSNLNERLARTKQRLVATAGVRTSEATVTLRLGGQTYTGKPDIIALVEFRGRYNLVVVEAKSSRETAMSAQTIIQASLYAIPAYLCTRYTQDCMIRGQNATLEIDARYHGLRTALKAELDRSMDWAAFSRSGISDFRVFIASPAGMEDVTEDSLNIIESLLAAPIYHTVSDDAIVPGPWCRYCEHFRRGTCSAGLAVPHT